MHRVAVPFIVSCCLLVVGAPPLSASPIDDAVAKAATLQRQIDANGQLTDLLSERLDQSRLELDRAEGSARRSEQRITSHQRHVWSLRRKLERRAVTMYERAGQHTGVHFAPASSADFARTAQYVKAADGRDDGLITELHRSLRDLQRDEHRALHDRQQAEAESLRLDAARTRVEEAGRFQQLLLDQAKGELGTLLAQAEAQQEQASLQTASVRVYAATDSVPQSSGAAAAVAFAVAQLGKPYVYAAAGPDTFDCSGLTMMAWRQAGIAMPHYSGSQYAMFPKVSLDALEPGDLVFFYHDLHHVGLYIGGGRMINAPQTGDVVRIAGIYRDSLAGAVRPVLPASPTTTAPAAVTS